MTDTASLRVKSLDHVTLVVRDLEASRRFYCDVLGMQQVARPDFSFDGRWFQAGETQIHLILEHETSGPAGENRDGMPQNSRHRHFAFLIDEADTALQVLQEHNVPILSGPKQRPDGAVQIFVTDPDGHVVELCAPAG